MARKKVKMKMFYFTHKHNIEGCLRNGSFVRVHCGNGSMVQWMNGDCMGQIDKIPKTMVMVDEKRALDLIPNCCK